MEVTTKGIVFSTIKYGEADLIVHCFTESDGLKSYLLRRILTARKGKLKMSLFQPLMLLELVAIHKNKGTLERIKEAKVAHPFKSLHANVSKSGMVLFLAEMLKNSIQEEEKNRELFQYIENALLWLDEHDAIANFHILFLLKLSAYLGFYPDASNIESQYFNLSEGNFQESPFGTYCEEGLKVEALKGFFGIDFDALPQIKLTKKVRLETLDLMLRYYQLHIQSYKRPKSLLVLNQLY
ncbi:DNA replication and repair protein RecO [Ulvibacter sp. MAR_2010_11]|uniref:DNA repair protein RecO n=1 Tax=Ulvibacter sp. MAR_2010_11 TaxID=1250229 RepID=UPI000C2C8602|nr:DNA repair protein RecO [Ulvibacter sp. MAR_2010_11]PKA83066.1 DNA replication and repair protein RecO [Ulvibacter sp. MAR_2010_11]